MLCNLSDKSKLHSQKKKMKSIWGSHCGVCNDYSPLQYDAMSSAVNIMVFQGNLLPPVLPDDGDSRFLWIIGTVLPDYIWCHLPEDGNLQIKVKVNLETACYHEFRCVV